MPALVTADLHLHASSKEAYRFAAMEHIAELIEKYKCDSLIILGDLTHAKNFHSDVLVNDVVDLLYNFSCLCPVYILQGNHDYVTEDCPFFHFVRRLAKVRWFNQPAMADVEGIGRCSFLPHTRDWKKTWAGVMDFWYEAEWIFAHNTFDGAVTETGKRMRGIPTNIFPKDVPVISGDIHKPQQLDCVTYVGSPYLIRYGDDFDPRVLLVDGGKMKSYPMPGPQKRLIEISSPDEIGDFTFGKGDMIKVRYRLKAKDRDKWPEIKEAIKRDLPGAIVQPVMEPSQLPVVEHIGLKEDEQLVREFGEQQQVSKATLATGFELLKVV